ncbi:hypothetical protein GUITHDRAFT_139280 [Guillardia theta CCMP2712]|uniref:Uncharacterized protein n=1 Tax=Guillardia theta (strain CCMP2712) TaxID=905079 RepID=L1J8W9_GUITC|nr:hypothetical protein GUITHDRAFT_139280 [Guillardia theta CCMP2712]EKX44998.1 hypothetical protein GUITHDRAFT_139280 [Guillardia theta CCMP2712]|eukprot:XP_005831978.1 hypothetical protein GUITHDRAFT_139280 [Guillardia theta CCMP2712]
MGRARASYANKSLGILFARAVTADVHDESKFRSSCTVDRTGKLSLFKALSLFMPSAIRNECNQVGRRGLTVVEYNKCLEQNGFPKARSRSPFLEDVENSQSKHAPGIKYFFVGKRWLNPRDCNDLKLLDAGWETLKGFFPLQEPSTLKAKLLLVCQRFHDAWEEVCVQALASKSSEIGMNSDCDSGCEQGQDQDRSFLPSSSSIPKSDRHCQNHRQHCASEYTTLNQGTCQRTAHEENTNPSHRIQLCEAKAEWPEAESNVNIQSPKDYTGETEDNDVYFPMVQEFCEVGCQICAINIILPC